MNSVDVHVLLCDAVQSHTRALWSSFNLSVRAVSLKTEDEHLLSQENILPKSPRIWLYTLVALLSFKARTLTVFPSMLKVCSISSLGRETDNPPHCLHGGKSHHPWAVAFLWDFKEIELRGVKYFYMTELELVIQLSLTKNSLTIWSNVMIKIVMPIYWAAVQTY